ncbi:MAG: N-acetylglucosamine-6-phosphate deacetylase [Verrucomicrobia bacterium]|nr:N-acetylglucosamine-6-phosphate deacetylase [Verrucomicrobiota bacterium]
MPDGEICAWHYATRQPVRLRPEDGGATQLKPAAAAPERDLWLAPALVDVQVNGFAGVDFQRDGLTGEELRRAASGLRAAGCGRFLLTLITDEWPRLMARLRHLRALRAESVQLRSAIAGWHVEGPFLSAEPGFHGAHEPALMRDPTPAHIRELRAVTGNDPVLLTLAPERSGALEAIALAASLGIRVSLGHTNASAEVLRRAVAAGATGFTHLGNACPQLLDRHDNILWRALDTPGLTVSVIPDKIHVSPALFRLIHRALPSESICYVTDAIAAAGAPAGRYSVGKLVVDVGADQIVRPPGKSNYAGSALDPFAGVLRAAEMLGCAWQEVWDGFSVRPAKFIGLGPPGELGGHVEFCLVEAAAGGRPRLVQTC